MRIIASHTGLRGIAALLVVLYHLQFGAAARLPIETATALPQRGYLAVDLFFLMSGFIIAHVNRADRPAPMTRAEARAFIGARLARVYPLLACSLAALLALAVARTGLAHALGRPDPSDWRASSLAVLLGQATLLNAWVPGPIGWNIPSWSISAEMGAYLLFPRLVTGLARRRRLTVVALTLSAAAFYAGIVAGGGSLDRIAAPWAPFRCLAGFALGVLLFMGRRKVDALPTGLLSASQAIGSVGCLAVLALPVPDPLAIPCFALLVATTATDRGWLSRLLAVRPAQWLGQVSYSIYLTHVIVLDAEGLLWAHLVGRTGLAPLPARLLWLALAFLSVIALSGLSFRTIERPGRQWLARRIAGHRLPAITAAPAAP